jgi:hypothetical protein
MNWERGEIPNMAASIKNLDKVLDKIDLQIYMPF